jgi:pimeloyl-ACP methyl ester carboxylesterase
LFSEIARCLRQFGSEKGLVVFKQTDAYRQLQAQSSDAAASISDLFSDPRAVDTIQRLERIPMDAPNRDRGEWKRIHVPTLVLGCRQDPIHPYEYARTLAQAIPGAEFKELTPKCVSVTRYLGELNEALRDFLAANYPGKD